MTQLIISALRVRGRAGCKPEERAQPQMFTFDLRLTFDAREAIAHDDVSYAPDYERVAATVRERLGSCEWRLLETMAYDVGKALLELNRQVSSVEVLVAKEILENAGRVAASLVVGREGLTPF